MWPKRKILFLIPSGIDGWQGIQALLNAMHREVILRETADQIPPDFTDLTYSGLDQALKDLSDVGPTDILYWPGISAENEYRQWGQERGLTQTELTDFLHRYWEEEIILPVPQAATEEEPLLWRLLNAADFSPSLLWRKQGGDWEVRIGQGLHWVISETWHKECFGAEQFGRQPKRILPESYWLKEGNTVNFYADNRNFEFLGSLDSCENDGLGEELYAAALQALRLGVPWKNIKGFYTLMNVNRNQTRNAVAPIDCDGNNSIQEENSLRWYSDEFARSPWPSGGEFPAKGTQHLESWGIS